MSVFAKQTRRYAKLTNPGDMVRGTITNISEPRQSIKYNSNPNAPKVLDFWEDPNGGPPRPKLEVVLTLQTQLNEGPNDEGDPDDGQRLLIVPVKAYKPGNMIYEIQAAMLRAGGKDLEVGGELGVRNTGTDPESQNPQNPRKTFEAMYALPPAGGGAFSQGAGQQQAAPQQAYQQPAQPPAQAFQQQAAQAGFYPAQQQAPQQPAQPAWQPPQQVNTATGEVGGGVPATDPWGAPIQQPGAQAAQQWQPPAEPARDPAMYQQPANPTPQQQQAAQAFNGGQSNQNWQPPAQQPAAQQPIVQNIDAGAIRALIQQGAPDGYIMEQTGASLEAVTAIRNI